MKKIFTILLLLLLTEQLWAWGANGHRVVGLIAEQHLNLKAKKRLNKILKNNSLAEVSTWMDDIKSDTVYDHTHDWHWVTIPDSATYDQAIKNPEGDIIAKIEEIIRILKEQKLSVEEEQVHVKYLVHLVGDLHQPLHIGTGDDRGGNDIKVEWFGKKSNLHRVWDSDMIDHKDLSYTELAGFINNPAEEQVKEWQAASVRDWAYESMRYRPKVYALPGNRKLGYHYSYENFSIVEIRLLQAGVRLAGILNEIYG